MRTDRIRQLSLPLLAYALAGMSTALAQSPAAAGSPAQASMPAQAGSPAAVASSPVVPRPHVVDYSYRVKWGHLDEFLALFRKTHSPILRR